jgi:hypothetical protein
MVLRINTGYSPDYLLKEVATGRENYYTGAVAEGEPPGRWWGSGAELLGLAGLVDAQDMRGVYERFLDPRTAVFTDPSRWDEQGAETLGHVGRKYLSEEELYAAAVEREPEADAERRMELRLEAGKNARQNVAFFDVTFSVAKSITLLHTAFEAQQVAAQRAGDLERAAAWGQFRQAVEDAIWAGNNAMLAYLNAEAGYSRIGHHGGVPRAGGSTPRTGWWPASSSTTPGSTTRTCTSTTRPSTASSAPTGCGAPWTGTCSTATARPRRQWGSARWRNSSSTPSGC